MNGAEFLRARQDELLSLLVTEIGDHIPNFNDGIEDTAHPLRRQRQRILRASVAGMADAIDALHGQTVEPMDWSQHVELGRLERRYGRPLSDILRAPWAASRAIVRFTHDRAAAVGLTPAAAQEIAEVVIDWSDRISIAFSEGYNDETAARAGELETRRQHLLRLALADTPPGPGALAEAARAAEWSPAPRVRVLVAAGLDRDDYRRRLPAGSLAAEIDDALCAIIPEHSETSRLAAHLPAGDRIAALGPPTPLSDAHRSGRLAHRAIALVRRSPGEAPAGPDADRESGTASLGLLGRSAPGTAQQSSAFIDCSTNELGLVVLADHTAAVEFSRRRLAPVLDKPKLIDTLDAWLATHGRPKAAAARLGVHPHTVSYRLERLRDHLGTIVDDPDRRLELHLATYVVRNGIPG